jgi:hypothetical protein
MNTQITLARACACLLLAMAGTHAHAAQIQAAAADPQAAVPATRYQSALGKQPDAAPTSTPDQNWVADNETVAATNSMSLTMKPMASHGGGHAGHGDTQAQAADPHAGHTMPGMAMDKKDGPAMCAPGGGAAGDGKGKMACCESGCSSCCCKDMMKKKETS